MAKGRKRKTPKNIRNTLLGDRKKFDQSKFSNANPELTAALLERIEEWEQLERDTGEIKSEEIFDEQSLTPLRDWGQNFPPLREWPEDILDRDNVFFDVWSAAIAAQACFGQSRSRAAILQKMEDITQPDHWTVKSFREEDFVLVLPLLETFLDAYLEDEILWLAGLKSALYTFLLVFGPEFDLNKYAAAWLGGRSTERENDYAHGSFQDMSSRTLDTLRLPLVTGGGNLSSARQFAINQGKHQLGQFRELQESLEKTKRLAGARDLESFRSVVETNRSLGQVQEATRTLDRLKRSTPLGASLNFRDRHALEELNEYNRLMQQLDPTGRLRKLK